MSVRRTVHLWCDACGEIIGSSDLSDRTAVEARRLARHEGCHVNLPGGRDICESCWAKGER